MLFNVCYNLYAIGWFVIVFWFMTIAVLFFREVERSDGKTIENEPFLNHIASSLPLCLMIYSIWCVLWVVFKLVEML